METTLIDLWVRSNSNDEGADMGGRGETVSYTRFFVTDIDDKKKKEQLKKNIVDIIDAATHSLTIITLGGTHPLPKDKYKDFP